MPQRARQNSPTTLGKVDVGLVKIAQDLGQYHNLREAYPEKVQELKQLLQQIRAKPLR